MRSISLSILVLCATTAFAQTTFVWNQIGGDAVSEGLAGPASGPVTAVWYSAAANRLLARTSSGRVFETTDFVSWRLNVTDPVPANSAAPPVTNDPDSGLITTTGAVRYSLTSNAVYSSVRSGAWTNLTGLNGQSILGSGFSALAVSPANPAEIVAANQSGIWRSLDSGLSWHGLNEGLPNLPARRLTAQRSILLADGTFAGITAGNWTAESGTDSDAALIAAIAAKTGAAPSAAAQSGSIIYAGFGPGQLLVSADNGSTWNEAHVGSTAPTRRIWIDPVRPQTALAAAGPALYRTTNGGKFWDPVTGSLGAGEIRGVAADSMAGIVYVATDSGLFTGKLSLTSADPAPAVWSALPAGLPYAGAWDVRLNNDGTLTVVLDGYGVYESPAPHAQSIRIVNGADLSDRAAAPGSLISIIGANVKQAGSGSVLFPVLFSSAQSSQLQVPFETNAGIVQLTVNIPGGVWTAPVNVKNAAPAVFVDNDGSPLIQDAESGLVIDSGTPIHAGARIQVLATGLGRVTPEWPTGVPAPVNAPPSVVAPVSAFLDGQPVQVVRATLAPTFIGYYLVELQLPAMVNRGVSELRIVVNGEESNPVRLSLESDLPQ